MATPLMAGLESQGIASHGPMPAGMLRIRQGNQERYVWPVHLGGWLAMGWRVAGSDGPTPSLATPAVVESALPPASRPGPVPAAVLDPVTAAESLSEPAPTRGRRGRRRKDEARTETSRQPEPGTTPGKDGARADSDGEPAGGDSSSQTDLDGALDVEPPSDAAADHDSAEAEPPPESEPALTALPDDLFNDSLI